VINNITSDNVIEAVNLWFKYPHGNWVLRGVDLSVKRGEHVLIIGDTGSGKTTLLRALTGLGVAVYGGEAKGSLRILGREISEYTTSELFRVIGIVGQNPYTYFTDLQVYRDLYYYAMRVYGDQARATRALNKVTEAFTLYSLLDRYFFELSGGEAKRVIIAKSLIADPHIVMLDEPLMWLDEHGVYEVTETLRILRRLGKSVIVFEHRFMPIIDYFDRVLVIRGGKLYEVTSSVKALLRKRESILIEERSESMISSEREVLLRATNIHHYYNSKLILRHVDLTVLRGDKILVYGANGSGKTTLLKILAGYLKPTLGVVERHTDTIYIPQNIILFYTEETVKREVEEICRSWRRGPRCIEDGLRAVKSLGIDVESSPFSLSHGQMVKLAVLIATISGATLLLLDEPFSGLTYIDRLKLVRDLVKLDKTILLASSWLELASVSGWSKLFKLEEHTLAPLSQVKLAYSLEDLAELYSKLTGGAVA